MQPSRSRGVISPTPAPFHRSGPSRLAPAVLLAGLLAVAGCATASRTPPPVVIETPPPPAAAVAPPPAPTPPDTVSAEEAADLAAVQAETFQGPVGSSNEDLDEELEAFLGEESDALLAERVGIDIPIVMNERVHYFIDYFQHRVRKSFVKWLARGSRTVPYLKERFREAGLPEDLVYLALIESGFSPRATSRANAVGYWQFIAPTARRYGLRVDSWVDERRDLERSTDAAIAYLQDLHRMFGSWYLAASAYNSGEGRIQRAIQRYGSENLWELSEFSYLREETKNYVPKLIAATLIVKEPEKYGFADVPDIPAVETDVVTVASQTDLEVLAASAGTTVETIRTLNPMLRSWATPPGAGDFEVKVPRGSAELFRERYAAIPASQRVLVRRHVVRRGETPSAIASRYGVSTQSLMASNGIRDARRLRVGQQLVVPRPPGAGRVGALPEALARLDEDDADRGASSPSTEAPEPGSGQPTARASVDVPTEAVPDDGGPGGPDAGPAPGEEGAGRDVAAAGSGEADDAAPAPETAGAPAPTETAAAAPTPTETVAAPAPAEAAAAPAPEPPLARRPPRTIAVRVGSGETLHRIATDHGVTVAEMERWNPHAVSGVTPGMLLRIEGSGSPDAAAERPTAVAMQPADSADGGAGGAGGDGTGGERRVHRVRRGETLWSIARRYGVTVAQVREWNERRGSAIRAGERLVIFP